MFPHDGGAVRGAGAPDRGSALERAYSCLSVWRVRMLADPELQGPSRRMLDSVRDHYWREAETFIKDDVEYASNCLMVSFLAEALELHAYGGGFGKIWRSELFPNGLTSFYGYDKYFHRSVCSRYMLEDSDALMGKLNVCKRFLLCVLAGGPFVHQTFTYLNMCSACLFETQHGVEYMESRLADRVCGHYCFVHPSHVHAPEPGELETRLAEMDGAQSAAASAGVSLTADDAVEDMQAGRKNALDVRSEREARMARRADNVEQHAFKTQNMNVLIECARAANKIRKTLTKARELRDQLTKARALLKEHEAPKYMHEVPLYHWYLAYASLRDLSAHKAHLVGGRRHYAVDTANPAVPAMVPAVALRSAVVRRAHEFLGYAHAGDTDLAAAVIKQAGVMKNVSTRSLRVSVYNEYLNAIVPPLVKLNMVGYYVPRYVFFKYYESMQFSPGMLTAHRNHLNSDIDLKDVLGSTFEQGKRIIGANTLGWHFFWMYANLEAYRIMHKLAAHRPSGNPLGISTRPTSLAKYFIVFGSTHIALKLKDVYIVEPIQNLYRLFLCWEKDVTADDADDLSEAGDASPPTAPPDGATPSSSPSQQQPVSAPSISAQTAPGPGPGPGQATAVGGSAIPGIPSAASSGSNPWILPIARRSYNVQASEAYRSQLEEEEDGDD
ncbi:protein Allo64 [Cyprinid herpesvirus 3]|uniref:ORF47R n=1 Tax=Cyprinid herpesvirus 3 TaxID=180230 RepID=A4FTF3_CYHV3|nr:ORF47R [Cyprinid herpesvirus 3]AOO32453.1 protein Allo64 [Cyprinid herpesvirus 3]AOO32612.1 protein Allo64 [Cyprinid herpesvirus 3]AOO32769.1 protein Allo64 [Cyprinid herpesvirus 3]AOO32926.1 protein Allo64 [Cyprinid herpesvirus 3]